MAITFPAPTDATHDYVPVDGRAVQVGDDILSLTISYGGVWTVDAPAPDWTFLITPPDGEFGLGSVSFPVDPGVMSTDWWNRTALWRQAAKPADATALTVGASTWIYPAGEDGRMVCYAAGSGHVRGDRAFRGALLTGANDLWINDDPDSDWLPVADGSEVVVGDVVRGLTTAAGVISEVFTFDATETTYGGAYLFGPVADGSPLVGYYLDVPASNAAWKPFNFSVLYRRLPKPSADTKFSAPDGSRWIYTGGDYYCWGRGTMYAPGSIFPRGEIAGGLTEIT